MEPNQPQIDWAFILAALTGSMSSLAVRVVQGKAINTILEIAKFLVGFSTAYYLGGAIVSWLGLSADFKTAIGFSIGLIGYNLTELIYFYGVKLKENPKQTLDELRGMIKK